MGVARQIGEHRCGSGKRPLGVHDPLALAQWREPVSKVAGVGQRRMLAEELQPPGSMELLEFFEEASTEQP